MIKKLHEDWEQLNPEARAAADKDPAHRQEILARLETLSTAFRQITEKSVTRVSLSQAVRSSLEEILKDEAALPAVTALRSEILAARRGAEETAAARAAAAEAKIGRELSALEERFAAGIRELRSGFRSDIEGLRASLAQAAAAHPPDPAPAPAVEAGALEGLEARVAERIVQLRSDLERESARLESGLTDRLKSGAEDFLGLRAGSIPERLEEQAGRISAMGQDLSSADDHLAAGLKDLETRLTGALKDLEAAASARIEGAEGRLQQNLAASETRLAEAQDLLEAKVLTASGDRTAQERQDLESRLTGRIGEVEANLGARIEGVDGSLRQGIAASAETLASAQLRLESGLGGRLEEARRMTDDLTARLVLVEEALPEFRSMEVRLRTQMEIAMDQISDKVNTLVDMVAQIQATLPPRQVFEGLQSRLESLEGRFRSVSDQLDGLEGAVPEMKSLGERLSGLRAEVAGLSGDVVSSEKELHETWNLLSMRVQEIQDLLRSSMEHMSADRSNYRQRLVDLRDTLHDQLEKAVQSATGAGASLWSKLTAKPEGGLRLGGEEWERFRSRMETVLQGLESLLTEGR